MVKRTDTQPEGIPMALKELPKPRKMRFWWQGGAPYGDDMTGFGTSSLHKAGCLVTSLHILSRYMNTSELADPGEANKAMKKVPGAFLGSDLVMAKGAAAVGLEAPADERLKLAFGDRRLSQLLEKTLEAGDAAIIHVSTDGDPKDGGEHFIAAYALTDTDILCADPALGTSVAIPRKTLEKTVLWNGKPKLYQVVSVAPIRPATA